MEVEARLRTPVITLEFPPPKSMSEVRKSNLDIVMAGGAGGAPIDREEVAARDAID